MSQLDTLRALLAAATPGKWRLGDESDLLSGLTASDRALQLDALRRRIFCDEGRGLRTVALANRHTEAALIAAAVTSLPALLAVAEAAQAYRAAVAEDSGKAIAGAALWQALDALESP